MKGELEPHSVPFVARVAVLSLFRRVPPALRREQFGDPLAIPSPHGQVEVVVRSAHPAGVKVDRPSTEQPVVDPVRLQQLAHRAEGPELRVLGLSQGSLPD
jgi:hypothetical protein